MGKTTRRVAIIAGSIAVVIVVAILLLWTLPFTGAPRLWRLDDYIEPGNAAEKAALVQAQVQATAVLVQILGGLLLVGTIYTAIHSVRQTQQGLELSREQLRVAQDQLRDETEINREQLRIAQEGQITERFTRAIEQLGACDEQGKARLEVRLGGIYALERIARDSLRDNGPIMEVLTAYVRENSPVLPGDQGKQPNITTDIQAVLTVIGRREDAQRRDPILALGGAHLEGADLRGAHLEGVSFSRAHLEGVLLDGAHLEGASLRLADLEEAGLWSADLEGADLREANLRGTRLEGANLEGANLEGARLEGTDLAEVRNLTQGQIDTTIMDEHTRLPEGLGLDGEPYRRSTRTVPETVPE